MSHPLHHIRVPRTREWLHATVATIAGRRYQVVWMIDDPSDAELQIALAPVDPGWPLAFVRLDQVDWPGHGRCLLSDLVASGPGCSVRLLTARMGVS